MRTRSWLYTRANHPRLLSNAEQSGADVVVIDLEDSVPAADKAAARAALNMQLEPATPVIRAVRISSLLSADGLEDLLYLHHQRLRPDIVIIPKCELPGHAEMVFEILRSRHPSLRIFALIESLRSFFALANLAHAPHYLGGVTFGSADMGTDMELDPINADMAYERRQIVLHAKRLGILAIDTPCFFLRNDARLNAECETGRELGFDGKQVVHPSHVQRVNECFTPRLGPLYANLDERDGGGIERSGAVMAGPPMRRYAQIVRRKQREIAD